MSQQNLPLALRFPLRGSRLIEASAGTGKTFTISALYLRLVLGHGDDETRFHRELLPPEILVVTFTDAATRELRDRIRARLVEAAQAFRGELDAPDPILQALLADYPEQQHAACARRLDIAAQWMDQAAVSTIHSWCQRMLREHAFDSGSLFAQQLETDHSELLADVARDYWREQCYSLQGPALRWVVEQWQQPDNLLARVRVLFREPSNETGQGLQELIEPVLEQATQRLAELKQPWLSWATELEQLLDRAFEAGQVNKQKIHSRYYRNWFEALRSWAADELLIELKLPDAAWNRLSPDGLAEGWKSSVVPAHPALDALSQLREQLRSLPDPGQQALRHAACWIRQRFEQEKRRRAEMGFDDMLERLDMALQGVNGERLAEVIRRQFPVAMIDEFQDTDPLQYRIYDRIYRVEANDPEHGLFLIGDPKQAIYAFRGADIFTYLQARQATAGRHDNLDTNFRSSEQMVAAVNHVFQLAEERPGGQGAFLFARDGDNPLPFIAVGARGRAEQWTVAGESPAALTAWQLPTDKPLASGNYRSEMAARCASEMVRLLNLGQRGEAGFLHPDKGMLPVCPADMAVLVRDFREAQAIRDELAARGVRSVYLSDKDSVFASAEAADVLRWLRACAEPDNDRLLRAALASPTLDLEWQLLDALNQDERIWEHRVFQFRDYRRIWLRQGVLPMLHRLLHDFDLPAQLLAGSDGERRLTNLLHLAELLQQSARELDGEQALIRHFEDLVLSSGDNTQDEQVLRLESDAALVKVVTIHKSKGLEYPLVFLPFICNTRLTQGDKPLVTHGDNGTRIVLQPTEDDVLRADAERLAEDVRLLYVALTRARHACWLGMADLKYGNNASSVLHRSAIGKLLGGGEPLSSSADLAAWLARWNAAAIALVQAPEVDEAHYAPPQAEQDVLSARQPQRRAAEHWWIASYSALRPGEVAVPRTRSDDASPDNPAAQKAADDDRRTVFQPLRPGETPTIHRFPRGPNPGTFLHGLLELAGNEGFAGLASPEACAQWLRPRCVRRGLTEWIVPLSEWLSGLLNRPVPLDAGPFSLAQLGREQYQPEMEFLFAASRVDVSALDQLVQAAIAPGVPRPELPAERLNGLFKGYMDLVLEHDGRYYVVDYKSNWLGADASAYTPQAMQAAVLEHRYDLQYVFYVLALHRQLRARLPGYDYGRHVGGALYWFIRGSEADNAGVWHDKPPRALIESLDALFAGAATGDDAEEMPREH
ncbi:exodeoxyribonuclease V subunit beta [Pseudomonas sp. G11-1]|nr:exodeoxyribonuclease V subunit beta [Pseudomonas sp. G11-1]MCO5791100.1 exodeoxyribonuclease V subunit beta [Pseudomonas sp. G11-2]